MPEKVHDCVESVLEDNPEMTEARAWAICQSEFDEETGELSTRDELGVDAEALDQLAEESDEWGAVEGGWVNTDENLAVFEGLEPDEQADSFGVDVFRIVQAEDGDMDLDGDVMGVGVDFPNAGTYVDWRIEAWPDDEQLQDPHVSDYGSVEDLEQATGGVVEHLQTVKAADGADSGGTDQEGVTLSGLSQEALADITTRYNVDVVDGEAGAAPTDHKSQSE
jgi:hypothetical protein